MKDYTGEQYKNLRYPFMFLFMLGIIFIFNCSTYAQQNVKYTTAYSDNDLYTLAKGSKDSASRLMFLTAYIERNPIVMQTNHEFSNVIHASWVDALSQSRLAAKNYPSLLAKVERNSGQGSASYRASQGNQGSVNLPDLPTQNGDAPQSYPLVCRLGGFSFYRVLSSQKEGIHLSLTFYKANFAFGNSWENATSLSPGECTWVDRTMHEDEPSQLVFGDPVLPIEEFNEGQQVLAIKLVGYEDYIILLETSALQVFNVYNDGKGEFIVTSLGSTKFVTN